MFYIIQILILGLIILNIRLNKKIKSDANNKMYLCISLIVASLLSNIVLSSITLPTSEVTLRALDDKHKDSESFEVKILNLEIDGKELSEFDLNEGKWMRNEEAYYMWRDAEDTRQPNGLTEEIKFNIPYGSNRNIVFTYDEYSGLVEIDDGTQIQVIDLYNQESITKKVEITANTKSQMNKVIIKRIVTWFIIGIYIFAIIVFLYQTAIKKPKTRDFIILSVILFTQVIIMIYYGGEKSGFHVDEVWTYEISNRDLSHGKEWDVHVNKEITEEIFNDWESYDFFENLLTVTEEQRFNLIEPYTISSTDNHPPLYYMIIRFISSLFPNTFSKWIGIIPNIIFFVLGNIVLYKISVIIFKGRETKWLPVIFWGFSIGAMSTVVYIRMYVLLTLSVLLFVHNYLKYVYNQSITVKSFFLMFIVTYLGCMTQYYFLIFAFFFTAYECFKRLFLKDYKNMFLFGLSILSGVVMLVITSPYAIERLFSGDKGSKAVERVTEGFDITLLFERLDAYVMIIERQIFGLEKNGLIPMIILIFGFIIFIVQSVEKYICEMNINKTQKIKIKLQSLTSNIAPITITTIIYIIVVAWISPYYVERYIVCTFPFICLLFIYYFEKTIKLTNFKNSKFVLPTFVIFIIINGGFSTEPYYLYQEYENDYYAEENSDIPVIHAKGDIGFRIAPSYPYFLYHDSILIYSSRSAIDDLSYLKELVDKKEGNMDKIILYIPNPIYINEYEDLEKFKNALGYQTAEKLHSSNISIYRLSNPRE